MNTIGDSGSNGDVTRPDLKPTPHWLSFRNVAWFCLFEVAFYFGYRFAMSFSQTSASPFWFPDSILLCALLVSSPKRWWLFALGTLPIRLFSEVARDNPVWFLLTTYIIDTSKALLAAAFLHRCLRNPARIETIKEFGLFFAFAVLLIPAASAFAGAAALHAYRGLDYWTAWHHWLMGDVLAQIVITPAILYWIIGWPRKIKLPSLKRCVEAVVVTVGLVLTGYVALRAVPGGLGFAESHFFAPVPFLFWAAIRFGMHGTAGAVIVLAALSVEAALSGRGLFADQSPNETALALQYFLLLRAAPLYLVAILIEQRKADELKLRASEERYREVVEAQTELVCRYLPDTTLTFVNGAYCRFFGKQREELIGRKFIELLPQASQGTMLQHIASILQAPRTHTSEHEVLLPDGSVGWQQWVDSIIPSADGQIKELQGIGRDITDRKRAEEATNTLAHASRLAVMGEYTAMIAHELNTPLGAILSNAEAGKMLLESDSPPLDKVTEILSDIRKDDLRASEAIRRIRALMRKRELEMQPMDLNETVSDAVKLASGDSVRRRVQIQCETSPALPLVRGDPVHLQQVLLNLILNGMDAMNDNPPSERHLLVSTHIDHNGVVEVAVKDVGHGIAPENLPRIFDSFFTTKRDGMGLGLSIAKSIIQLHSGKIWAENNCDGKGATFHFTVRANTTASLP